MFRLPVSLMAGIAHGVMRGLIPDARRKMAEQAIRLQKEAGKLVGKGSHDRHPLHGTRLQTAEYSEHKARVRATHTGGDHAKDPRDDKYLNSHARRQRAYQRGTQAAV